MNRLFLMLTAVLVLFALPACSSDDHDHDHDHEEGHAHDEEHDAEEEVSAEQSPDRIAIPAAVRSNLGITFARAERRRVDKTIRVPGAFELQPHARHEYHMVLPGEVELKVNQYQRVEPGDLLYRLRSPQWPELQHEIVEAEQAIQTADADIAVARARIDEARARLELVKQRLASLADAQTKNADLEAQAREIEATLPRLQAELELAQIKLGNARRTHEHALHVASSATGIEASRLGAQIQQEGEAVPAYQTIEWIEVRATRSGVVEVLALTDGAFAQATSLVLSTIDPSQLRFRALALQADLARLHEGAQAMIVPPANQLTSHDGGVSAQVSLGLEAHPEQRTLTLLATTTESRKWIRAGVSAFLEVTVQSTDEPAVAIPRSAIVQDGIVHVFFRRDPDNPNSAIRVEADMGVSDGRWVVINTGLSANDEVVLNGAYELKLASQQGGVSQKGGHFHADGTFHEEH